MNSLRSSREKPMRRRAYSNADVTLLASRFGCLLSTSEPDRRSLTLARRPTFVSGCEDSGSLTSSVAALSDAASEPINNGAMRDCCSESSTEPEFEDSSETQTSDNRPIKSPLARSRASVREARYDQPIGSLVRSSGSSNESESSVGAKHRATFSIDSTDDDGADSARGTTGLRKSVSEGVLPSQRASIDEDALTDTIAAVNRRMSKPQRAQRPRLWRRKSKLERLLEENDPNFTLIHYCSDLLCRVPPRLFRVPNMAVAPYMRTCLMRAHASSVDADPFRICNCRAAACDHLTPDAIAKFAAVYVLDTSAGIDAARRYRNSLITHAHRSDLGAGAWQEYEISPLDTEFNNAARVTFVYLISGFF